MIILILKDEYEKELDKESQQLKEIWLEIANLKNKSEEDENK
jgi:hypothetical protein